jgi:PA14 domain
MKYNTLTGNQLSMLTLGGLALGMMATALRSEVLNEIRFYDNSGGGVTGVVPNNVTTGAGPLFQTGATGLPPTNSGTPAGLQRETGVAGSGGTDTYRLTAHGSDYWGAADRGAFAFDNTAAGQSGDFSAVVRSVAVSPNPADYLAANWGRSGLDARVDVNSSTSKHVDTYRESGGNPSPSGGGVIAQNARLNDLADAEPFRQVIGSQAANNANGSVRNTPIWLSLARTGGQYYSAFAPDSGGAPGTWSPVAARDPNAFGSPELLGTVQVGLFHQAHTEGSSGSPAMDGTNTAVFDHFQVNNPGNTANFMATLLSRGRFPGPSSQTLTGLNSSNQVTGSVFVNELNSGNLEGFNWSVRLLGTPTPGLRHNLFTNQSALNSSGAWNAFLSGNPTPQVSSTPPAIAPPGAGSIALAHSPGVWFGNQNSGINFYPSGWDTAPGMTPTGGDGASNYGVQMVGEIFLPEAGTYRFKDGVDDYTYLAINGQVLVDDNNWTSADGSSGDVNAVGGVGSPIVSFNAGAAGWYVFEMRSQEGGGGDNTALYWDYDAFDSDTDGVKLGDNAAFGQTKPSPSGPGALVPYANFRNFEDAILDERSGIEVVNGVFSPGDPSFTCAGNGCTRCARACQFCAFWPRPPHDPATAALFRVGVRRIKLAYHA